MVSTWVSVWWHQQNLDWTGLDYKHELPVGPGRLNFGACHATFLISIDIF